MFMHIRRIIETDLSKKKLDKAACDYYKEAWSIRSTLSLALSRSKIIIVAARAIVISRLGILFRNALRYLVLAGLNLSLVLPYYLPSYCRNYLVVSLVPCLVECSVECLVLLVVLNKV
jgi:hypothetical protein